MDLTLILLIIIIPLIAQGYIKMCYSKYEKVANKKQMTGFDVAREILDKNGLESVLVLETNSGVLSDYYDPRRKVVKLSPDVYRNASVSAMSVAAHECGHAIQDKVGYGPLKIRSMLVPVVNFTSNIGYILIVLAFMFEALDLLFVGVGLSMFAVLFQVVTLPVEFNASTRAKEELNSLSIADEREQSGVKTVLTSAALTYVASLLASLLQMLRYVLIFVNRRD